MAVQEWLITVLVDRAADDAGARYRAWCAARRPREEQIVTTTHWPKRIRQSVSRYLDRVIAHRHRPPVVYYSQHVDSWSSGGTLDDYFDGLEMLPVLFDDGELWCYPMPDAGRLIYWARERIRSTPFVESRWLMHRLIEAAMSYQPLWSSAVMLIHRRALGPSSTDDEKIAEATRNARRLMRSSKT